MDITVAGILVLLGLIFSLVMSYHYMKRGNWKASLVFILFLGFILRFYCIFDPGLHKWDERYHALVAKNLVENPLKPTLYKNPVLPYDLRSWTSNHIWLHKQPMALWCMAGSMAVFGNEMWAVRLPSLLVSTASIFLTFCIAFLLFQSRRVALMASLFHAVNGLIIALSAGRLSTDHIDTFFLFFVSLGVFFVLMDYRYRRPYYLLLGGVACGLAVLTKWLPGLIIVPLYITLNAKNITWQALIIRSCAILMVALTVFLPWQIYASTIYPSEYNWEQNYNFLHFTSSIEGHGQPWWYFLDRIRITINELIYPALFLFVKCAWVGKIGTRESIFAAVFIGLPMAIFSMAVSKMQGYIVFTFPAYFIVLAMVIEITLYSDTSVSQKTHIFSWKSLIALLVFVLGIRYGLEKVKVFQDLTVDKIEQQKLLDLDIPKGSVVFNSKTPIELMFHHDCTAYDFVPQVEVIDSLRQVGHQVVVLEE